MPPGFENFNPSCTQKSRHIVVARLASVPHKLPKTIGHRRSKWLQHYFRLLLSESLSSGSQWYPFWNSDIPTSQSALKQSYTEDTNGQNNDDKIKKPTLGSHSISVNYCNILAYFHIMHNKFKAVLTILSSDKVRTFSRYKWSSTHCLGHFIVWLPIHAPNHLSCHLPMLCIYICTQNLFWSFANAWPASIYIISGSVD